MADLQSNNPKIAPYSSWKSPITSKLIASGAIRLGQIEVDGEDVYWIESRPMEGGRNVIIHRSRDGSIEDYLPEPFNARTRVHEYGGGAFRVSGGWLYFSNFSDQRVYRQELGREPQPITPPLEMRYADFELDRRRNRLVCVREDHTHPGIDAINTLVELYIEGPNDSPAGGEILVSGSDFYSNPRLSPDGQRLAWLAWNHPNMPWDGTELWVGELDSFGRVSRSRLVAGGPRESIFQPEWSPEGILYFVSDRSGWWNLYRWEEGEAEALYSIEAEFGLPQWVYRQSTYGFVSEMSMICSYIQQGQSYLGRLDLDSKKLDNIEVPYTAINNVFVNSGMVFMEAGSPTEPASIIQLELASGDIRVLRRSIEIDIEPGYLSSPMAINFPTQGGFRAHAFYYPPRNKDFSPPPGELPPLLVMSHGGPTSMTTTTLDLRRQFWSSRGIAVLDVNYGGSTGYGRDYRKRLDGQWGIVDVQDCIHGARYLVERGEVDGNRLAITGGSAGGYTTLCALTFHETFKAGASYFGISDLEGLVLDTHKFESRYSDQLVGRYEEMRYVYYERSPIHHVERLSAPMIIFQGLEDRVVPPEQSEKMYSAVRDKGLPVAYLAFEGEQHGFRRAETIERSLEAELYFYSRVFGFDVADEIRPIPIENLPLG